jgi:hypothetical protein
MNYITFPRCMSLIIRRFQIKHRVVFPSLLILEINTSRYWFAMQGPVAIILNSWNVIFIWETGYWTRAINRFTLFDLLKSLYSDTKILSKYIIKRQTSPFHYDSKFPTATITVFITILEQNRKNSCQSSTKLSFTVFRLLTDCVCLYTYEFWLSLCKIVRSSVILLLPLFSVFIKGFVRKVTRRINNWSKKNYFLADKHQIFKTCMLYL